MLPNQALRDGFSLWLDEVVGPKRVRYGRLWLDPFATSCRNTARFAPWLVEVAQGSQVGGSDPVQHVVDMKAFGVVVGEHPEPKTTSMGENVLDRWSRLGLIAAGGDVPEIARCAILYREGRRASDESQRRRYAGYMRSYQRLIALRPHAYWTQDLHHLYLPMFLDQEDQRGFNPLEVLAVLCDGDIGPVEQWREWATQDWEGSAKLSFLLEKVKSCRFTGTHLFVQALQACLVADAAPKKFSSLLSSWGYVDV